MTKRSISGSKKNSLTRFENVPFWPLLTSMLVVAFLSFFLLGFWHQASAEAGITSCPENTWWSFGDCAIGVSKFNWSEPKSLGNQLTTSCFAFLGRKRGRKIGLFGKFSALCSRWLCSAKQMVMKCRRWRVFVSLIILRFRERVRALASRIFSAPALAMSVPFASSQHNPCGLLQNLSTWWSSLLLLAVGSTSLWCIS